jgi:hypothetical protein
LLPTGSCIVQRCLPIMILCIGISTCSHQQLYCCLLPPVRSKV